jgi:hypothetical protein
VMMIMKTPITCTIALETEALWPSETPEASSSATRRYNQKTACC